MNWRMETLYGLAYNFGPAAGDVVQGVGVVQGQSKIQSGIIPRVEWMLL